MGFINKKEFSISTLYTLSQGQRQDIISYSINNREVPLSHFEAELSSSAALYKKTIFTYTGKKTLEYVDIPPIEFESSKVIMRHYSLFK